MLRFLLCLIGLFLGPSTSSVVCLDSFFSLCLQTSYSADGSTVFFEGTCTPTPGSEAVTWCGFGFSSVPTSTMFPAEILVMQWNETAVWVEDRDASAGYQLPPCYSAQASTLLSGSRDAGGVLRASWKRPVYANSTLQGMGYIDYIPSTSLTAIGASSSDGAAATTLCADYMTPHTFIQPGVSFSFPPAARPSV